MNKRLYVWGVEIKHLCRRGGKKAYIGMCRNMCRKEIRPGRDPAFFEARMLSVLTSHLLTVDTERELGRRSAPERRTVPTNSITRKNRGGNFVDSWTLWIRRHFLEKEREKKGTYLESHFYWKLNGES